MIRLQGARQCILKSPCCLAIPLRRHMMAHSHTHLLTSFQNLHLQFHIQGNQCSREHCNVLLLC
jgi:hypothetical protein